MESYLLADADSVVARARQGDETALEALYRAFEVPVYNLARRICRTTEDAEDVLQETFFEVCRSIGRYREEGKRARVMIRALADRVRRGERLTLLCSSACADPARCHRTLLSAILDYLMDKTLAELTFRSLAEGLGISAYVLVYHFGSRGSGRKLGRGIESPRSSRVVFHATQFAVPRALLYEITDVCPRMRKSSSFAGSGEAFDGLPNGR